MFNGYSGSQHTIWLILASACRICQGQHSAQLCTYFDRLHVTGYCPVLTSTHCRDSGVSETGLKKDNKNKNSIGGPGLVFKLLLQCCTLLCTHVQLFSPAKLTRPCKQLEQSRGFVPVELTGLCKHLEQRSCFVPAKLTCPGKLLEQRRASYLPS